MPEITDYDSFKTFFNTYDTRFNLKSVFVGTLDDFMATLSKRASYPCLYVERPTESGDFDGDIVFTARLFYLVPGSNLSDDVKQAAYSNSRAQLRLILMDLREKGLIDASKRFQIDYKDIYLSDGLIGAFSEVDIKGYGTDFNDCNP